MVRFEQKLQACAVQEWADYYLDYGVLKRLLTRTEGRNYELRSPLHDDASSRIALYENLLSKSSESDPSGTNLGDERFRQAFISEIFKADSFFLETKDRLSAELDLLHTQSAATQALSKHNKTTRNHSSVSNLSDSSLGSITPLPLIEASFHSLRSRQPKLKPLPTVIYSSAMIWKGLIMT